MGKRDQLHKMNSLEVSIQEKKLINVGVTIGW